MMHVNVLKTLTNTINMTHEYGNINTAITKNCNGSVLSIIFWETELEKIMYQRASYYDKLNVRATHIFCNSYLKY